MAEFKQFRSSIGGFNRQDVSDYIEKMSHEHLEQMHTCESVINMLRSECEDLKKQRDALNAKVKRLHRLFADLQDTFRAIDEEQED